MEIKGGVSEGVLAAREVEAGKSTSKRPAPFKFDLEGPVEVIVLDSNFNPLAVVVNGEKIAVEALTWVKTVLEPGKVVSIEVVVGYGEFVADKIKEGTGEESRQ